MKRTKAFACTGAILCLSSCVVGPDFVRPSAPDVKGYAEDALSETTVSSDVSGGEAQRFVWEMDIPGQWWTAFRSEALNALITRAIANNPDLKAAEAALKVAEHSARASAAAYYPRIDADLTSQRARTSRAVSPVTSSNSSYYGLHTAQVSVTYSPDLFGGRWRSIEGARARRDVQRFQLHAAYVSLTSNVILAAIEEASIRAQIEATEEIVKIAGDLVELIQRQFDLGQIAQSDLIAQNAALSAARQTLLPLRKRLLQQRNLLTALAGEFPSQPSRQSFYFDALDLPVTVPVSLPSRLVEQRPDIRAAEAAMHAASADIGVAVANRLPSLTLTASGGSTAVAFNDLFNAGTAFWGLAAGLTQPIFAGGSLRHQELAARASFDQAAEQYRSTVIAAFHDVANALHALVIDGESLRTAAEYERSAAQSLEIVQRRLEYGEVSYLAALSAQQAYQQSKLALIQARSDRYADTVALFFALGGGWWNANNAARGDDEQR